MSIVKIKKSVEYDEEELYGKTIPRKRIYIGVRVSDLGLKAGPELKKMLKGKYMLKKIESKRIFLCFFVKYYLGRKRKIIPENYILGKFLGLSENFVYYNNFTPYLPDEIDSEILMKAVERNRHRLGTLGLKLPKRRGN